MKKLKIIFLTNISCFLLLSFLPNYMTAQNSCVIEAPDDQGAIFGGNDCSSAVPLGALDLACSCDGSSVSPYTWSVSNIGATPGSVPYPSILECAGVGGDQAGPAADIWFTVEITGNNLIVDIEGDLDNPNIAIWGGDCELGLVPLGCATGTGGVLSAVMPNVSVGDVIFLQVSGGDENDQGDFNLTLYNDNLCDNCVTESNLSIDPLPVNGYYVANQTVEYCLTVENFEQVETNWFHGVSISVADGWGTVVETSNPGENFYYFEDEPTDYGSLTGFFWDSDLLDNGTDFSNNYGVSPIDINGEPIDYGPWTFCWELTTPDEGNCIEGASLRVDFLTWADGQVGSWTNLACESDDGYTAPATLTCCPFPLVDSEPESCIGMEDGQATATGQGLAPFTYNWSGPNGFSASESSSGSNTQTNLDPGTYVVEVISDNGCAQSRSIEVESSEVNCAAGCLIEEMNITLNPCDGNGNFSIDGEISFVDAPTTGTLTISDCNGYSAVLNAPFTSPETFSITDIPADGAACDLTAVFSDDTNCSLTISNTNIGDCGCPANAGTYTTFILGESSNNYVLCYGDTIASLSNGDYIPANDINDPTTVAYDPGVSWFIYSCPPTVGVTPDPANPIVNDPCILGIISDFDFVDINDMFLIDQFPAGTFTDNIIYFVPITMYNITDAIYSFTDTGVPCYEMGDPVAVQYLPEITTNQQEDCVDGSLTVTVSGGFPELDGSQFTGQNLTPATASFLTGTASNGGDIVVTGLNDGDAYSFEIVDANDCPVVIEGTFTGIEDPSFSYDATGYCQEEGSTSPSLTGTAGGTFTATPAGLSINATDGTIDLVNSVPGDYTVTYTTPSTVCGDASDVSVSVYPTPVFTVSGLAPTACGVADGFITLSGLEAGEQYQVGYSNDGAAVGPISLTADANGYVQITGLLPGTYGDIVVVSSNGCSVVNTNVVILEDLEAPFIDAGADASICIGESVTLTATNPEGANLTWTGNVQDGVAFTPTATSTTTYIVAAERDGCVSTDNVTVVVNPLPDVSAGQDVIVCSGYTVLLTAQGAATYTWDNGVQNSIPFVPTTTQMYTVTGTSAQGCSSEDSVLVTVEEVGAINFEADVLSGCVPVETTLNNLSTDPSLSCQWQVEGQTFTGCSDVNVMLNVAGCFDVTLQVTTANGCVGTETYEDYICVDPYPVASFEADPMQVNSIDPTVNFTNTSEGANLFEWYFGDGSDVTEEFSPSHDFPNSEGGSYVTRLIATSDAGCSDTTSVLIRVLEDLIFYVPNSFTPDGDEHNQSFQPVFTSGFDPYDYNLLIFNRWGEVVFESNDHRVGWDGSYGSESNQMVKEVTYVWKIEFKTVNTDERQVHTGHVTILR